MKIDIIKDKKKYSLLAVYECGNSGHYEQKIICNNLSHKKALMLKNKLETEKI